MSNDETARAFSGHRFEDAFASIAPDATWNLVGHGRLEGREAIVEACRSTMQENEAVETTWLRFVWAGTGDVVAVDAVGRYVGPDGVSVVSSCDVYEFEAGLIRAITSYTVELPPTEA